MAAERVRQYLDRAGITYDADVHERAVDAQHLAAVEHVSGWEIAKPVMLVVGEELVMAVIPGAAEVDLDRAGTAFDAEVRLARESEFVDRFPDCSLGAEPPFGMLYGVPTFVDPILREDETIVFRAGTHDTAMRVRTEDYLRVVDAQELELAALPVS